MNTPMASRTYVDISRPYELIPGRLDAELAFPATTKRRAEQHHDIAAALASLYGLDYTTPYKLNPRWSAYEERWGNRERFGWPDYRRLRVSGPDRTMARYLAALPRVLTDVERLATRAARAFGQWRRSMLAALRGHLEYEDASTLRVRSATFRADVLGRLVKYLRTGAPTTAPARDNARPLWEQPATVAAEVWENCPVDPWDAPEHEVQAVLDRAVRLTPPQEQDDQAATSGTTTAVPDTVDELLALAGPENEAPAEADLAIGQSTREARRDEPLQLALIRCPDTVPAPEPAQRDRRGQRSRGEFPHGGAPWVSLPSAPTKPPARLPAPAEPGAERRTQLQAAASHAGHDHRRHRPTARA